VRISLSLLWAAVASAVGLLVLAGFFIQLPILIAIGRVLVGLAVLLAAFALLLGLYNLLAVHLRKISLQEKGWPYSALLVVFLLATFTLGVVFGPDNPVALVVFNSFQLPVEASLMALLAVTLTLAAFRLIARRRDLLSFIFVAVAVLVLLGTGPWPSGEASGVFILVGNLRNWLAQVWAAGGARGILMGVALGAAATGLRVLLASDRPYGE
jgi:hypothetical protein